VTGPGDVLPGGRAAVDDEGRVTFHVRVEAPSWMNVATLRLLENGVVISEQDLDGADPVVRFDGVLEATPSADAWYAVQVEGEGSLAPVSWRGKPYAMSNPIEVDADLDGVWTAPR